MVFVTVDVDTVEINDKDSGSVTVTVAVTCKVVSTSHRLKSGKACLDGRKRRYVVRTCHRCGCSRSRDAEAAAGR